jgi:hypothetical protein
MSGPARLSAPAARAVSELGLSAALRAAEAHAAWCRLMVALLGPACPYQVAVYRRCGQLMEDDASVIRMQLLRGSGL